MSWQGIVQDSAPLGDRQETAVVLTDGTQKYVRRFINDGSLASLKPQLLTVVTQTTDFETKKAKNELIPGTVIDLTPPIVTPSVDVPQTPAQVWRSVRSQFRARRELFIDGLIPVDDAQLVALQKTMAQTFVDDPAYTGGLP